MCMYVFLSVCMDYQTRRTQSQQDESLFRLGGSMVARGSESFGSFMSWSASSSVPADFGLVVGLWGLQCQPGKPSSRKRIGHYTQRYPIIETKQPIIMDHRLSAWQQGFSSELSEVLRTSPIDPPQGGVAKYRQLLHVWHESLRVSSRFVLKLGTMRSARSFDWKKMQLSRRWSPR